MTVHKPGLRSYLPAMMTPDQARDRAADAVARAIRAGADAADASLSASSAADVSVRLGALEDVGRSEHEELGLRVFVGRRSASVASSDLSPASLDALVERVLAMASGAPEDEWAGLAPEERLLRGPAPDLDLADAEDPDPASLREAALAAEDAARAVPGVTNSEGGNAGASRGTWALATSTGFAGAYQTTGHSLSAIVLAGTAGGMERDFAHHSARHRIDLEDPQAIGRRAGERAVRRLDPGRAPSGIMPIVFDPRVGGSLVGHLLGAISGPAITRKTSFLLESLGEQVFAEGVTIHDAPLRPRGLRSRPFDGEGLAVGDACIIERGRLTTWLLDSASARQLGLAPTGHAARGVGAPGVGTSNLYMEAGDLPPEALIADIARGILVTELIGQGVNGVTGDYSRGAAGFLIEKGEITRPVSEFTIAGNLRAMYRALTPASDLEFRHAINVPTLRIEGMIVAGG